MEVCVDLIASVENAVAGGSRRLELCSSLDVGGLTPTVGFFKIAREIVPEDCKLFVMIRPRPHDFVYTDRELLVMLEDVRAFKALGADGFVFGCLARRDGFDVNVEQCEALIREASPLPCTFHRAIDEVKNSFLSLSLLEGIGFKRILTSGQQETAFAGRKKIRTLVNYCKSSKFKVVIMPGGGINAGNLESILEETGAKEFHGSAKPKKEAFEATSAELVKEMIEIGKRFECSYQ